MKYYKIKVNNTLDVITSNNFFIDNGTQLLASNEVLGQYVEYNGALYRDYWMAPTLNDKYQFRMIDIQQITQEEYFAFKQAQHSNEAINSFIEEEVVKEPMVEPAAPDEFIEYIRSGKLNEMSNACAHAIEEGFDLEIRGETKHFSLTIQDQLNLISLDRMAQNQSLIPYHADGEDVIFYTPEEINDIIDSANALKIYHTTYYNALKNYINALNTIEEISAIEYGIEIPEQYQTEVFKVIGGN